ncbi:uridine kinase [Clostridium novyi A str. 4552]|uniref:Uridine kinase n=1 Tax=Clostridium novyi A str. 4552 TaxID=1444289 RepID=A0A0A0I5R2_CLONO|nr:MULTISPECIES: uridine kinase [Clostridium]EDS77310.1 uridine kinase [Clostridium botulinum C str. Eklund]KEH97715.1 uridine kinase [Clostridium botulinum C/D str. BKT12695]KGM96167.1 uridine kinase [Clostridium novyi A str. 4552]NEZ48331.1 uridine kinase [Clostridium botulinum]
MMRPILIGITGGTGSGKSTVANEIYESFKDDCIAIIEQDSYYKDQSHLTFEDRIKTNYDHPNAFDTELLVEHLKELSSGKSINKPIYDFKEHNRKKEMIKVEAKDIVIVEGIMILQDVELRNLLDIKIYVDTDDDVRIIRRILRDIKERGRTIDSVVDQYLNVVKPMHSQFIEPTKKYADIIIPEGGQNKVAIDIMVSKIKQILSENKQ